MLIWRKILSVSSWFRYLWRSDRATLIFVLSPLGRICENAKAKVLKCEGERAKVQRCYGEAWRAKAKERYNYYYFVSHIRTVAFAFFACIQEVLVDYICTVSPKVCQLISEIVGMHGLGNRAYYKFLFIFLTCNETFMFTSATNT